VGAEGQGSAGRKGKGRFSARGDGGNGFGSQGQTASRQKNEPWKRGASRIERNTVREKVEERREKGPNPVRVFYGQDGLNFNIKA